MKLRASTYDYDTNAEGDLSGLQCQDESLAQQHMKDECDINVLVKRFVVSGEIPQLDDPPLQGDFSEARTYQEMLNLMVAANQSFMQQPADVRARFQNDPGQFVDFVSDPANGEEVQKMGYWSDEATARLTREQQARKDLAEANAAKAAKLDALELTQKGVS